MTISINRWIARQIIPDMLKMGLTRAAGMRVLQGEGVGVRKQDFLDDWREKAGLELKRDPLRAIPKQGKPTERTIERTTAVQRKKFNYNYDITGYDPILGKDIEDYITVASDDLISMEEAEEEAQRLADKYKVDIEIAEMIISGVTVTKT